ncbi:unnamed protein product, partial [Choristocarpus tenellus]
ILGTPLWTRTSTYSGHWTRIWIPSSSPFMPRLQQVGSALALLEVGGMAGSDIIYYETESGSLTDSFATGNDSPTKDESTADWTLMSSEEGADWLVFEAERLLITNDTQDWPLVNDTVEGASPTRVIAAWGDTSAISYHGLTNRVTGSVVFYGERSPASDPLVDVKGESGVSYFDVAPVDFVIPNDTTTYEETCLTQANLAALGVPSTAFHIVGFEANINSDTEPHVHHLVMRAFIDENCEGYFGFADVYVWAPGSASGEALPDVAGFRFDGGGGLSDYKSIWVETHYDNPSNIAGLMDSSGVRVYYTENLRQYDAGTMQLGDPYVTLQGEYLPNGRSLYSFNCPSSCTQGFQNDSVTVFGHLLHMHEAGRRMETRQYCGDKLIRSSEVEYYMFSQSGAYPTRTVGETIEKGDWFETDCYYDSGTDGKIFGLASENEMCIDFIFYYPVQTLEYLGYCGLGDLRGGALTGITELSNESDFGREFGI